jgi:hypothetical protein
VQVRHGCAAVDVAALHAGLRARQAACLRLLDTFTGFLRTVTADGGRAFEEWPEDDASDC